MFHGRTLILCGGITEGSLEERTLELVLFNVKAF